MPQYEFFLYAGSAVNFFFCYQIWFKKGLLGLLFLFIIVAEFSAIIIVAEFSAIIMRF